MPELSVHEGASIYSSRALSYGIGSMRLLCDLLVPLGRLDYVFVSFEAALGLSAQGVQQSINLQSSYRD